MRTVASDEDLEHVAGDHPNGRLGTFDLSQGALGRVRVPYKDTGIFIDCEVYQHAGEPMQIHWMCPRCHGGGKGHMSRITGDRKKIEFDPTRLKNMGGCLNVEAFTCPWELGEDRRMEFGLGMCKLTVAIDNSVAKDA
jgi:hypothetical protein